LMFSLAIRTSGPVYVTLRQVHGNLTD